jgi:hypothetical protein
MVREIPSYRPTTTLQDPASHRRQPALVMVWCAMHVCAENEGGRAASNSLCVERRELTRHPRDCSSNSISSSSYLSGLEVPGDQSSKRVAGDLVPILPCPPWTRA